MLGLLSYLPTIALVPHMAFLLAITYAIGIRMLQVYYIRDGSLLRENKINVNFVIIGIIVLLSLANNINHYESFSSITSLFPFYLLIPFSVLIAFTLTPLDFKVLAILGTVESIVVLIEYQLGISTFFTSLKMYAEFDNSGLLYATRPLGLSGNSSIAAAKIFLSYLIIDYMGFRGSRWFIVKLILLMGIFLTFNRSTLLVLSVYFGVISIRAALKLKTTRLRYMSIVAISTILLAIGFFVVGSYLDEVVGQLTRNKGRVELSGRELIWADYIEFIKENLLFGNGSFKLYMGELHAHNSYLQTLATNGIIISLLYFYLVLRNFNMQNAVFVAVILIFSFFQYGIFWGISLMDIFLFVLLLRKREDIQTYRLPVLKKPGVDLLPAPDG
jgi:O-antigen ligase